MKRLANLKSSGSDHSGQVSQKRVNIKSKRNSVTKNNPYPISGRADTNQRRQSNGHLSFTTPISSRYEPSSRSQTSLPDSQHDHTPNGKKSAAPTVSTNGETAMSEAAFSKAGTSGTAARTEGGRDSTFSSPAPSVRSLTTTLTTVHSMVTSNNNQNGSAQQNNNGGQTSNFSHPFTTSPPPTAVPAHLVPHNHPTTYHSAVANNALTDDASILTLASSTKRRRRNSLDTNASVRALAPQSVWGGSRESLPLSVLSGPEPAGSIYNAQGTISRPSMGGIASTERASVYSSSGVVPALASERNSYIAKPVAGDAASVRSGRHARGDSLSNSIGGPAATRDGLLTGPASASSTGQFSGKLNKKGSEWGEVTGEETRGDDDGDDKSELGSAHDEKDGDKQG